jgi:L-aminopeptidase/D-esterase-like protein
MALGIDGLRVGTWTSPAGPSGCTVLLPPEGAVGAIAVRGQAPGTREAAALGPFGKVAVIHGVVLSGGSAFGLATADGVMRWLEAHGVGYALPTGIVPIVGGAIVLDQGATDPAVRPDAAAGWAACQAATADEPAEGSVGAGTGVSVAKVGGIGHAWRGGQGCAVRREGDLVVGALVVNNAVGEVVGEDGQVVLVGSRAPADASRFPADPEALARGLDRLHPDLALTAADPEVAEAEKAAVDGAPVGPTANTVIGCVVTNARLDKLDLHRVADLGHDGIARAVRPAHTSLDGDALFAVGVPTVDAPLDLVTHLAVEAVADAARRGPLHARGGHGLPGRADTTA